jgi:hypothetical protein
VLFYSSSYYPLDFLEISFPKHSITMCYFIMNKNCSQFKFVHKSFDSIVKEQKNCYNGFVLFFKNHEKTND